jgi:hypothetical protein
MHFRKIFIVLAVLNSSLIFSQWNIKSGGYYEIFKLDESNLMKWYHANGLFFGTDYQFKNNFLLSFSLNYHKNYSRSERISSNTIQNQLTTTYFKGTKDWFIIDFDIGYAFEIKNKSWLHLTVGINQPAELNIKFTDSYTETQYFYSNSNPDSNPYMTQTSFYDGNANSLLNSTFSERLSRLMVFPSFKVNFRHSFSRCINLDVFARFTIHSLRIGVGVVYKLNRTKNEK